MEAMRPFAVQRVTSLGDAARALASTPGARLLAGGTDLVPNLRRRLERPAVLIDLGGVAGAFRTIDIDADGVTLGAGVTLAAIGNDPRLTGPFVAIAEAARSVAAPAHREAATLGGNLALDTRCAFYNHSEWWRAANGFCLKRGGTVCHVAPQGTRCHAAFSGDLAAALLALDATVELVAHDHARIVPLALLYRDDGAAHLTLAPHEMIAAVRVPCAGVRSGYRKARVRGSFDFPLAGVGVALTVADGLLQTLRIALTGTNACPFVLDGTAALLGTRVTDDTGAAIAKLVQRQVSPMRTTITAANYRRQVAAVLARRLVTELARA